MLPRSVLELLHSFGPIEKNSFEDETLGGSFHTTPPRPTQVPPVGPTSGGAEDLATLIALSSLVSELVQKVSTLKSELKAHKLLFTDVVPKLMWIGMLKNALANAAMTIDSTKSPGGPSKNPDACSYDPTSDVPTIGVPSTEFPTDVPSVGAPMAMSQAFEMTKVQEREQHEVLDLLQTHSDAAWDHNFGSRMVALVNTRRKELAEQRAQERRERPMTPSQLRQYMRTYVKNQVLLYTLLNRRMRPILKIHTDDNVDDLLTKAFDGPRVFNSPMLHLLRVEMVINSPWIMPLLGTKGLASPEQTAIVGLFNKATKTANYMVLEGVLMKNKDAASSRDIQLICAEFSSIQVKTQADWMLLQSSYFNPQVSTSRYVVPTGRVVVPTGRYVVPAGKVIIIVSPGRLSLVPTGRVLSPGRVK
ncbi:hypothetical protein Tco_1384283 [Tanacetum coccineum]